MGESPVEAGSGAGVVQADLVGPAGDAGLGFQGGGGLASAGSLQAGRWVAQVGRWARRGVLQVRRRSGHLAGAAVGGLTLLLDLLLAGLLHVAVVRSAMREAALSLTALAGRLAGNERAGRALRT